VFCHVTLLILVTLSAMTALYANYVQQDLIFVTAFTDPSCEPDESGPHPQILLCLIPFNINFPTDGYVPPSDRFSLVYD
jgi:hypothetical protein